MAQQLQDMTLEERAAELLALHAPDQYKVEEMLYSVWEDGEVTLEKGGSLFGQRSLHVIVPGDPLAGLPAAMPVPNSSGTHGRIFVKDHATALRACALLGNRYGQLFG